MPPIAQLATESIRHREVAIEALTRMGNGERLPFTSEIAVYCSKCKPPPLGYPDVLQLDMSNSPGRVVIQHSCGHRSQFALGLKKSIRFNANTWTQTEPEIQHFIASQTPSVFQKLRLYHFQKPAKGYCSAEKMIALGLFSLGAPTNNHYPTAPTAYMLEQMAQHDPICVWVHQHVAEAAALSEPPSQTLDEVQWYQHRNVFFLPPGTLQMDGHDCPILAYAVVETGSYTLLDAKDSYLNIGKKLLVWIVSPTNHTTYTWEVLLRGNLSEHTYEAITTNLNMALLYGGHTCAASSSEAEFMERAIKLILVLNTLGLTPQATAGSVECVKRRQLSKQSRRRGRTGEHKTFTCPWFTFNRNPASKRRYKSTGRKMPPHNKPGWFQRYYKKTKEGIIIVIWVYRPPHRANAHLDPE